VYVSEALDVVEDEPREGDQHKKDKGDGDKEHRGPVDVTEGQRVTRSYGYVHPHARTVVDERGYVVTALLLYEHGYDIVNCKTPPK